MKSTFLKHELGQSTINECPRGQLKFRGHSKGKPGASTTNRLDVRFAISLPIEFAIKQIIKMPAQEKLEAEPPMLIAAATASPKCACELCREKS